MTYFNGSGANVWIDALAAFSTQDLAFDFDDHELQFRKEIDGVEYVLSLSNSDGAFKWPGGEPDPGELPSGPVRNLVIASEDGGNVSIFDFSKTLSVREVLDLASVKDVETALFSGDDTLDGTAKANVLRGLRGDDALQGGGGEDELSGGTGADRLWGNSGSDELFGGAGKDRLFGGTSADTLTGGDGRDRFVFESEKESGAKLSERDVVTDFERGSDRIELTGKFDKGPDIAFIGEDAFDGKGQLRFEVDDKGATVFVNLDDDAKAEFSIRLLGVETLSADDFIL